MNRSFWFAFRFVFTRLRTTLDRALPVNFQCLGYHPDCWVRTATASHVRPPRLSPALDEFLGFDIRTDRYQMPLPSTFQRTELHGHRLQTPPPSRTRPITLPHDEHRWKNI